MSLGMLVWADVASNSRYGVDNEGRITATRNFLVRFDDVTLYNSEPRKIYAILTHPDIPKYGEYLFDGEPLPAPYTQQPRVTAITANLAQDSQPNDYRVVVEYGYASASTAGWSESGDEPDRTRERFPWEMPTTLAMSWNGGIQETVELGKYYGTITATDAIAEKETEGDKTAGDAVDTRPFMNTADDYLKNIPVVNKATAVLTIEFSRLEGAPWIPASTIPAKLFCVSNSTTTVRYGVSEATNFVFPAGTLQLTGFGITPQALTDSATWRRNKEHPFDPSKGYNDYSTDITVYRYFTYHKYTLTFEYRKAGYMLYLLNCGMRQRDAVGSKTLVPVAKDKIYVTDPVPLNEAGMYVEGEGEDPSKQLFVKYFVYNLDPFDFINQLPNQ